MRHCKSSRLLPRGLTLLHEPTVMLACRAAGAQAMGHLQRKIAAKVAIPDERQLSSAGASTSGRFTKCHKCAYLCSTCMPSRDHGGPDSFIAIYFFRHGLCHAGCL